MIRLFSSQHFEIIKKRSYARKNIVTDCLGVGSVHYCGFLSQYNGQIANISVIVLRFYIRPQSKHPTETFRPNTMVTRQIRVDLFWSSCFWSAIVETLEARSAICADAIRPQRGALFMRFSRERTPPSTFADSQEDFCPADNKPHPKGSLRLGTWVKYQL